MKKKNFVGLKNGSKFGSPDKCPMKKNRWERPQHCFLLCGFSSSPSLPKSMLTKCVYFKIPPPPNVTFFFWGGGRIFFSLKSLKFDSETQDFFQSFFGGVPISQNTQHPKKSICTHSRHKSRFFFLRKNAVFGLFGLKSAIFSSSNPTEPKNGLGITPKFFWGLWDLFG